MDNDLDRDHAQAVSLLAGLSRSIGKVIKGQDEAIRLLLAAFASGGHVLLEDVPGTGKTTLAKALALSLGLTFKRIQFTPDLLPSDIIGVSYFDPQKHDFCFREGPVFTHLLLADEINRASPRTQSALLEVMAEGQVSVEGQVRLLSEPFMVIATQNPVEFHGTYPLPEAQMDRFAIRFGLGYLPIELEVEILRERLTADPLSSLAASASREEALVVRRALGRVGVSDEIKRYIVALTAATRSAPGVALGASPRASLSLMKMAQGLSLMDGERFVSPDQVRAVAVVVLAHRLTLDPQARFAGRTAQRVVGDLLASVRVPV